MNEPRTIRVLGCGGDYEDWPNPNYKERMNEQDQIRAIAELDGWVWHGDSAWDTNLPYWKNKEGIAYQWLPHYLTSYDAIIPVIQKQQETNLDVRYAISYVLQSLRFGFNSKNLDHAEATDLLLCASPSQLCEALLRATGKWIE